ncbi:UNVERIFIED_CONTAM: hypothetical protein Sangu_2998400 [Sesamum angustifolium]|uniref:Uncharacterized protein n=1 Tax=Sesamum angustifolium TaxID=2727405 RepID=A0AAW2KNG5_9LAMI
MADQGGINIRWEAMEARVRRLEELIGKPEQPPSVGLIQQVSSIQEMVESLRMKVKEELPETVLKGLESVSDEISCLTDAVDYKLESLKADLRLVKLAVANSGTDGSAVAPKVRVPDPKPFAVSGAPKNLRTSCGTWKRIFRQRECQIRRRCLSQACISPGTLNCGGVLVCRMTPVPTGNVLRRGRY